MKNINEIELALKEMRKTWLESTTLWSDFSADYETGLRQWREAVEYDFLSINDPVSDIEETEENCDLIADAMEMRSEYLYDTLQSMDLL